MAVTNSFQPHFKQKSHYLQIQTQEINCGVSLHQVNKIFSLMALTAVPTAPNYLAGVFNYHGSMVPVIDLSLRLGQKPVAIYSSNTPIVLCNALENEAFLGLIVSSVGNVIEINHSHLQLAPQLQEKSLPFSAVYQQQQTCCFLLNIDALLGSSLANLYGISPDKINKIMKNNF